jgi:hypothetical protein
VYAGFSKSGRYVVFSSNVIVPAFHSLVGKRLEVYDSKSDVYVADFDKNRILRCALLSDSDVLETFPTFSPDGKYIYFCSAKAQEIPTDYKKVRYNLCKIAFNPANCTFGNKVETVVDMASKGKSITFPRPSYDGKYLMFTLADYGTFPIWHRETRGKQTDLPVVRAFHKVSTVVPNCRFAGSKAIRQRLYFNFFTSEGNDGKKVNPVIFSSSDTLIAYFIYCVSLYALWSSLKAIV